MRGRGKRPGSHCWRMRIKFRKISVGSRWVKVNGRGILRSILSDYSMRHVNYQHNGLVQSLPSKAIPQLFSADRGTLVTGPAALPPERATRRACK